MRYKGSWLTAIYLLIKTQVMDAIREHLDNTITTESL